MKQINTVSYEAVKQCYEIWADSEGTEKSFHEVIPADSYDVEEMITHMSFRKDGTVNGQFDEPRLRQRLANLEEGLCFVKNQKGFEDLERIKAPKIFVRGVMFANRSKGQQQTFHVFCECEKGHRFAKEFSNLLTGVDILEIPRNCPGCSTKRPREKQSSRKYKWKAVPVETIKGYLVEAFGLDPKAFDVFEIEPTEAGVRRFRFSPTGEAVVVTSKGGNSTTVPRPMEMSQNCLTAALNHTSRSHETSFFGCFNNQASTIVDLKELCLKAEVIINADLDSNEDTRNYKLTFLVQGEDQQLVKEVYGVANSGHAKITYQIRQASAPPRRKTTHVSMITAVVRSGSVYDKKNRRFIGYVDRKQDAAPTHGFRMYLALLTAANGVPFIKIGHTRSSFVADRFGPENRAVGGAAVDVLHSVALNARTVPTKGHMEAIERELRKDVRKYCRDNFKAENYRFGDYTEDRYPLTRSGGHSECMRILSHRDREAVISHTKVLMNRLPIAYGEGVTFEEN